MAVCGGDHINTKYIMEKAMVRGRIFMAMVLAVWFSGLCTTLAADTWYVDNDAPEDPDPNNPAVSNPNENGSMNHPFDAIQEAIDTSTSGDTVIVLKGIYTGSGNKNIDFKGKAITVRNTKPNDPNVVEATIIDCEGWGRGFIFINQEEPDSVLEGFSIINGNARDNYCGSGIYCDHSSPAINYCVLLDNSAEQNGDGMYNFFSNPILTNCVFRENAGDGIYNHNSNPTLNYCTFEKNDRGMSNYGYDSEVILDNCIFVENSAGGMSNKNCNGSGVILENCLFVNNSVNSDGGGIYNESSTVSITNCRFSINKANNLGGGICNWLDSTVTITNCVFNENEASNGGGICNLGDEYQEPSLIMQNCTFSGNSATDDGGAILCGGSYSEVVLSNCILWGDAAAGHGAEVYIDGSRVSIEYCDVEENGVHINFSGSVKWGDGNIEVDPNFVGAEDFHLRPESPCIDAGTNTPDAGLPYTDMEGIGRSQDGNGDWISVADMGAYEYPFEGETPLIAFMPDRFWFVGTEGGDNPPEQSLTIWNGGIGMLNWQISDDCTWLEADPNLGSNDIGFTEVTVRVDTSGLAVGRYNCLLTISDEEAINDPQTIEVTLWIFNAGTKLIPNDYDTIQAAINAASNGDVIVAAPNRYLGEIEFYNIWSKSVTLRSAEPTDPKVVAETIIDGENWHRGFYFHGVYDSDIVIEGFSIINGRYNSYDGGGGIYCYTGESTSTVITVNYCVFSNNSAIYKGGGIYVGTGDLTINHCTFIANSAEKGGGVYATHYRSNLEMNHCTFIDNSAENGGAIYNDNSSNLTLAQCTFQENTADINGGGIYNDSRGITLYFCTFQGNTALSGNGGAVNGSGGVENCIFSGNSADGGGAIYSTGGIGLRNCSLSGNWASSQGGGIWSYEASLTSCILWGNSDTNGTGATSQLTCTIPAVKFSCIQDADPDDGLIPFNDGPEPPWGDGTNYNIDDDPRFVRNPDDGGDGWGVGDNDDYGDVHLRSDSPCIDAGSASLKGNFYGQDIDGQTRFTGSRMDMGADEFTPVVMVTNPQAGDVWAARSTRKITWEAQDLAGNVDLLYSTNDGADWTVIEPNAPNTGSYDWEVPLLDSETCLVKLAAITPPDHIIYRESGLFAIRTSLPGPEVESSWPTLGNNFQRTGLSNFSGPEIGCVKWQFAADSPIHQGVTSGATGRVHVASEAGTLYTLNPDGVLAWSFDAGSEITNTPTVGADGTVYFGCADGKIWAVDKDGLVRWNHHAAWPVQSSAAIADDDGKVFLGSADGVVYALDPNGIELWQKRFDDEGTKAATFTAAPAIGLDGSIYVGALFDPNLYALDPETGDIRWRCALSRWSGNELGMITGSLFTTPVVAADGTIYVAPMHDTFLYAIDPADGNILWAVNLLDTSLGMATTSVVDRILGRYCWSKPALGPEGTIYVSFDDTYQFALNPEETLSVYKEDTYLRAVNPNGTFAWTTRLGRGDNFSLSVGADGLVYATADDGSLYVVNAEGEEVSRFDSSDWQRYPVSYWSFDQSSGTVATDTLGGKHGMLHNFPTDDSQWTAGKIDGALQFDGADDYVRIEPAESLSGQRSKRIRAWMQTSSDGVIYSESRTPGSTQRWMWLLSVSGGKPLVQVLPPGMYLPVAGTTSVADGKWHLLEAVYKVNAKIQGSQYFPPEEGFDEVMIYVDGKLDVQTQFPSYDSIIKQGENMIVGAHYNGSAFSAHFKGRLDEVQVSFDTDNTLHSVALGADGTLYVCDSDYRLWAIGQEDCDEEPLRLGRIADFNHDSIVNLLDYADLGRSWQRNTDPYHLYERSEEAPYLVGDVNRDLYVDTADLVAFTRQWLYFDELE
jgi:predicted outer membrane repeat protein